MMSLEKRVYASFIYHRQNLSSFSFTEEQTQNLQNFRKKHLMANHPYPRGNTA